MERGQEEWREGRRSRERAGGVEPWRWEGGRLKDRVWPTMAASPSFSSCFSLS